MAKRDASQLLAEARTRYAAAVEAEREIRCEAEKDLEFVSGNQWNDADRQERQRSGKPCLTFNRLPVFVQQVVNAARKSKPAVKVGPADDTTDKDTARIMNGLVRAIEYDSSADVAYDTAFEYSVSCGFGYYRLTTDWEGDGFEQCLKVSAIADPFSVYLDCYAREYDRSDARWGFVVESYGHDEFKQKWPDAEIVSLNFEHEQAGDWIDKEAVRVAEYWYVETKPRTRVLLEDGSNHWADELPPGVPVVRSRIVEQRSVKCCITNGVEVLEEKDWAGQWIPIVPVYGKELYVKGKRKLFSLVRFARDPQQLYNFYRTSEAETVSMGTKAPWVGYEGQFRDVRWKDANIRNYAYLEVSPTMVNGSPAPLPIRNTFEPPIQAYSAGALQASDDIKATMGMFDASIGAESNEKSGIAILRRDQQSDTATFHYSDNAARSRKHLGRMMVDAIPLYYDTPRQARIIGDDEEQTIVRLNQTYQDENGEIHSYMLDAGKYDVTVKTGPSYDTQRQEAFDMLTQFTQAYPQLMQVAGDIIFRNADIPGAEQLADRLKKTLPPGLAEEDEKGDPQAQVQALQQQLQSVLQQHQQLTQLVEQQSDEIRTKKYEIDSREKIEYEKIEVQREEIAAKTQVDLAKLGSTEAIKGLEQQVAFILQRMQLEHQAETEEARLQQQATEPESDPLPIAA